MTFEQRVTALLAAYPYTGRRFVNNSEPKALHGVQDPDMRQKLAELWIATHKDWEPPEFPHDEPEEDAYP